MNFFSSYDFPRESLLWLRGGKLILLVQFAPGGYGSDRGNYIALYGLTIHVVSADSGPRGTSPGPDLTRLRSLVVLSQSI